MAKNIAFKCTYNNGGPGIGFEGACSEEIIKRNIEDKRAWCCSKDCECREYYEKKFKGKRSLC